MITYKEALIELDKNGIYPSDWLLIDTHDYIIEEYDSIESFIKDYLGGELIDGNIKQNKTYLCVFSNSFGDAQIDVDFDAAISMSNRNNIGLFLYLLKD